MKASHICCVILLIILAMYFFQTKSSNMKSYYAPSSCSCNKPQRQGVYMPNMDAPPSDSSKPNKTYML